MSWRQAFGNFIRAGTTLSMVGGLAGAGCYIAYCDSTRYPRMMATYAHGNLLPPLAENVYETVYFRRPALEQMLRRVLQATFSNEYYLINGDVGTGKTRCLVELTRDLMSTDGKQGLGAPIYVLANQGVSFSDTLAAAVNFHFDEHLSLSFFVDFMLRIHSMPLRDEKHRLVRVMDAIEASGFAYMQKTGRPAVIVIDGIDCLLKTNPGALDLIQEKAKLWADANIVKVVLVNNEEDTEEYLWKNASSWSRLAPPIIVEDMSKEEALAFLCAPHFLELETVSHPDCEHRYMDHKSAQRIVDLVGGRIVHLLAFKRDWLKGIPFNKTAEELKDCEREKLFQIWRSPGSWHVIEALLEAPNNGLMMSELIKHSSFSNISALAKKSVIRYDRDPVRGLVVTFRSTLTKHVVDEVQELYEKSFDVKGSK